MSPKVIEKILNNSFNIIDYDVELDIKSDTFIIEMQIEAPRDNQDWSNLMQLKNKIRSEVSRVYKIGFEINYTMKFTT